MTGKIQPIIPARAKINPITMIKISKLLAYLNLSQNADHAQCPAWKRDSAVDKQKSSKNDAGCRWTYFSQ